MNSFTPMFQQSSLTNTVPRTYVTHHHQLDSLLPWQQKAPADCATKTPAPISEFSLADMGVDQDRLVSDIAPTFDSLTLDIYEKRRQEVVLLKQLCPANTALLNKFLPDYLSSKAALTDISEVISQLSSQELIELSNIGTVRFRSIAKFDVVFTNSPSPRIQRVSANGFVQQTTDKTDFRSFARYFEEASEYVTDSIEIRQILRYIAAKVRKQHPTPVHSMVVTLHQVIVSVDSKTPFHLPDGVHQDGADYIVSAIPLIMSGVLPPLSTVYDSQLHPMLETRLGVGQGLLHDDRSYWHSVSALMASGANGQRGTIGLDVQIAG